MGRTKSDEAVKPGYFVYIGPTIKSAIQRNTIVTGSREEVEKKLKYAIEKYPPIAQLLISGNEPRKMIRQPGNRLYEVYGRLIRLLNKNGG